MKRVLVLSLMVCLGIGVFAQAKYQSKVVVLFLGEKNPTFDESKFPDIDFYYTPDIVATEKTTSSLGGAIASKITGDDYSQAYDVDFSGSPEAVYATKMTETLMFDKNGTISGLYKSFDNICISPKKNMQGTMDFVNYNAFSKDYVKKGKETKQAKKAPKKPKHLFDYYGREIPTDFDVMDAQGKKVSIKSLVSGEPLTILHTLYVNPDADYKSGIESGADKSGKEYLSDNHNTSTSYNRIKILFHFEEAIFGNKVSL